MSILIKNPSTEEKVRLLAEITGESLTTAVDLAVEQRLAVEKMRRRRKPTLEEMRAATEKFRTAIGLDVKTWKPFSKAEWDALWPTGIPEIDDA